MPAIPDAAKILAFLFKTLCAACRAEKIHPAANFMFGRGFFRTYGHSADRIFRTHGRTTQNRQAGKHSI